MRYKRTAIFILLVFALGLFIGAGVSFALLHTADSGKGSVPAVDPLPLLEKLEEDYPTLLSDFRVMGGEERMDIIGRVVEIEAAVLGLPETPTVIHKEMDSLVGASYTAKLNEITISEQLLANGTLYGTIESICHECFHAYQYELVRICDSLSEERRNLLVFEDVPEYKSNLSEYISAVDDVELYDRQALEIKANEHAAEEVYIFAPYIH